MAKPISNFTSEELDIFEERLNRVIATFNKNLNGLVKYHRPAVEVETLVDITINHSLVNLIKTSTFYIEGTSADNYEPYLEAIERIQVRLSEVAA
ncbi:MAG: hypothetical protein LBN08_06685 [Lactobacillales bacterium]|jgi:hypothetical protein|nr:hypothetical protein [Lactobacillales bacterium]